MTELERQLSKHNPTRVVATLADGELRELKPSKNTRKRWVPILGPLKQLPWVQVELFQGPTTVAVVRNPEADAGDDDAPAAKRGECCPNCGRPMGVDDLDRMIRAQRETATWHDKSVRAALDASVGIVRELGSAVGVLSKVQELQLERMYAATRATQQLLPAGGDDDLPGAPLLQQMLPMILGKLTAPDGDELAELVNKLPAEKIAAIMRAAQKPANGSGNGSDH